MDEEDVADEEGEEDGVGVGSGALARMRRSTLLGELGFLQYYTEQNIGSEVAELAHTHDSALPGSTSSRQQFTSNKESIKQPDINPM